MYASSLSSIQIQTIFSIQVSSRHHAETLSIYASISTDVQQQVEAGGSSPNFLHFAALDEDLTWPDLTWFVLYFSSFVTEIEEGREKGWLLVEYNNQTKWSQM